ncbi:MAG: hypothetical protein AAGF19_02350 [Pseudomonadota bacterium]
MAGADQGTLAALGAIAILIGSQANEGQSMKKLMVGTAAALLFLAGPAAADVYEQCVSVVTADDTVPASVAADTVEPGCKCMVDGAAGDDALMANLADVFSNAKYEDRIAATNEQSLALAQECFDLSG